MGGKQNKEAPPPAPAGGKVPSKMEKAAESLDEKIESLDKRIEACTAEAKRLTALSVSQPSAKAKAMSQLKQKKQLETQRDQLMATKNNLDNLQANVETAQINQEVMAAMAQGAAQLKKETVKIEDVDNVMDSLQETTADLKEVQELLAGPIGGQDGVDEDELNDELAAMYQQQAEDDVANLLGPSPTAVSPATTAPAQTTGYTPTTAAPVASKAAPTALAG